MVLYPVSLSSRYPFRSVDRLQTSERLVAREMAIEARTANEAARLCAEILGRSQRDIPFALVYLSDSVGKQLRLAGHAGLEPGTLACMLTVDMADVDAVGWPLARVAREGEESRESFEIGPICAGGTDGEGAL